MQLYALLKTLFATLMVGSMAMVHADNAWQFGSTATLMSGQYKDALLMDKQEGVGLHFTGDYLDQWGFKAGLQSTQIDLHSITGLSPSTNQSQDNWLISGYKNIYSTTLAGRWTFKLDAHQVTNNSQQSSNEVQAIAPLIQWASSTHPIILDFGMANSKYKDTKPIYQTSPGIAIGFNNNQDWLSARIYFISNLDPSNAMSHDKTRSTDFKFTHFFQSQVTGIPTSVSLGLERGQKIYNIDVVTQTLYNLPMLHEGGESLSASWKVAPKTSFTLFAGKARYFFNPTPSIANHFSLATFSLQLGTAW
jgi:hypothetical protein